MSQDTEKITITVTADEDGFYHWCGATGAMSPTVTRTEFRILERGGLHKVQGKQYGFKRLHTEILGKRKKRSLFNRDPGYQSGGFVTSTEPWEGEWEDWFTWNSDGTVDPGRAVWNIASDTSPLYCDSYDEAVSWLEWFYGKTATIIDREWR